MRRILLTLAVLGAVAVAVAVGFSGWIEGELGRVGRETIENRLSEATGLAVVIAGDLDMDLLPVPRLQASEITVANLPGRSNPQLARIGALNLQLSLWPLLQGKVDIHAIAGSDIEIHIEPAPATTEGKGEWAFDIASLVDEAEEPHAPLEFHVRRADIENARIVIVDDQAHTPDSIRIATLQIQSDAWGHPVSFQVGGDIDGQEFTLSGVHGSHRVVRSGEPFPVEIVGRLFAADIDIKGTIAEPLALAGLDLIFQIDLHDLKAVPGLPEWLAPLGALRTSGRLVNPDDVLGIQDLRLESDKPVAVLASGSVRDLVHLEGIEATIRYRSSRPVVLGTLLERSLLGVRGVSADLQVSDASGPLGVEGEIRSGGPNDAVEASAKGKLSDVWARRGLDARVELRAKDLAAVGIAADIHERLPALGPVRFQGRVRDAGGTLGASEISARLGERERSWLEVTGQVRDVEKFKGVNLEGRFGLPDLEAVATYLGRALPTLGPVGGSARLTDSDGTLGLENIKVEGERTKRFEIRVSGTLDHILERDDVEIDLYLRAHSLGELGQVFDVSVPDIGEVEFEGRVHGSDEKLDSHGRMRLDQTRFEGDWSASIPRQGRPRFKGRFRSAHIYLDDLGIAPEYRTPRDEPTPAEATPASPQRKPSDYLRLLDADLDVRAELMTGRHDLRVHDVKLRARLENANLRLRYHDSGDDGFLDYDVHVDARESEPEISLDLTSVGEDLQRQLAQYYEDTDFAGLFDVQAKLQSRGETLETILANLDGQAMGVLRDGAIAGEYAERFVFNFARVSLPSLLQKQEPAPVACFAVALTLLQGIATVDVFHLESRNATITGEGRIDLPGNRFRLTLTPTPHDPGLVSVAVTTRVRGPLNDPTFTPVTRSLATSLLRGVAHNVLRPGLAVMGRLRTNEVKVEQACAHGLSPILAPSGKDP